jgi:hypothetical protein
MPNRHFFKKAEVRKKAQAHLGQLKGSARKRLNRLNKPRLSLDEQFRRFKEAEQFKNPTPQLQHQLLGSIRGGDPW